MSFLLRLPSAILQTGALVFGKIAALQMATFHPAEVARNGPYWLSLACMGIQAVLWPQVLRRFPLFWSYLFTSTIYLAIPVVSWSVFKEPISHWNLIGSVLIVCGILTIFSDSREVLHG